MWRWGKGKQENTAESRGAAAGQPATVAKSSVVQCPLCGKKFQAGEAIACSACRLAAKCGLVMCPNCSYEFAP